MKIAILSQVSGNAAIKQCSAVPRVGDSVCLWHNPAPIVASIFWWPNEETLAKLALPEDVEVIAFTE
tara:strand:- start:6605 stop:6805 length:201 start_codon:yes stop_codon:yes gene_type:complete